MNILTPLVAQAVVDSSATVDVLSLDGSHSSRVVQLFSDHVLKILDTHAPLVMKRITSRKHASWWNPRARRYRLLLRRLEIRWRRTKSIFASEQYLHLKVKYHAFLRSLKSSYVTKILSDFSVSNKKSWYVLNSTLGRAATFKLPSHDSDYDLANQFNTFFLSKVGSLVSSFSPPVLNRYASSASTNHFIEFDCVTERGILSILN
jgi:hypothetical protein